MAQRSRYQVTLCMLPGAETWYIVDHSWGKLRVPGCVTLDELVGLVQDKTRGSFKPKYPGEATVRIPLSVAASAGLL